MGQSLSQQYIHLIFGTKARHPYITEEVTEPLQSYMAGILKNMDSPAIKINSVSDHVHILFRLSKNQALAKVVEEVKKSSSKWLKENGLNSFTWQIGYAAFSVSASKVEVAIQYIANQKEHHKKKTYREEVEALMCSYGVKEYDAKYFWE